MQIAGYANADYDDDKKLDPMFTILEKSDCKMQVTQWNLDYAFADNPPEYEILYYGKRSFASSEGLVYLPGDVDVKILHNFSMAEKLWDLRFLFTCQL